MGSFAEKQTQLEKQKTCYAWGATLFFDKWLAPLEFALFCSMVLL